MYLKRKILPLILLSGLIQSLSAQVNPEIQLAARGVMSYNFDKSPG